MSTVQEIETAIANLPREDFWKLTDRLIALRNEAWDRQIDEDAAAGRLDFLFEEAESERKTGALREWPSPPE